MSLAFSVLLYKGFSLFTKYVWYIKQSAFEGNTAHVQSFINGSKSGSIESLKLLVVYKNYHNGWNKETIDEHGKEMYKWLEDSM